MTVSQISSATCQHNYLVRIRLDDGTTIQRHGDSIHQVAARLHNAADQTCLQDDHGGAGSVYDIVCKRLQARIAA